MLSILALKKSGLDLLISQNATTRGAGGGKSMITFARECYCYTRIRNVREQEIVFTRTATVPKVNTFTGFSFIGESTCHRLLEL